MSNEIHGEVEGTFNKQIFYMSLENDYEVNEESERERTSNRSYSKYQHITLFPLKVGRVESVVCTFHRRILLTFRCRFASRLNGKTLSKSNLSIRELRVLLNKNTSLYLN